MKTKEFIKLLKEADPSGEAHIRMDGGIPQYAELKEGYWDGPYTYIDNDGNYTLSINGMKVDIYCIDIDEFIEKYLNIHDTNNWEYIKSKLKFELGGYVNSGQRNERKDNLLKNAKEIYDEQYTFHKKYFDESEKRSIKNIKENWRYYQNKLVDDKTLIPNMHHYYTWKIYNANGREEGSNIHNVEGVYKSNKFERLDNNKKKGYYEWKLKI